MPVAALFILAVLAVLAVTDWIFLPKQARRGFWLMAAVFALIGVLAFLPGLLNRAAALVGIGRGVDLVLYLAVIGLIREYFLSRARQGALEAQLTQLVRQLAIDRPKSRSGQPSRGPSEA